MRKPKEWGQGCPKPECSQYKLLNRGNVSAVATYETQSGKRRIFKCRECGTRFSETQDTVFFDLRTGEEKVMMALKMLLVKMGLSDISFVMGVRPGTVCEWLRRAAEKAEEINEHLMRELGVSQIQLDEMWSFIKRKHSLEAEADGESPEAALDGRQWVWISYAPEFRLMVAACVGPRTIETARCLIEQTAARVAGIPAFFSDGFSCYFNVLVAVYFHIREFARTGRRGRPRQPVVEPHPDLVYAQVVKPQTGEHRPILKRVRCGADRLATLGLQISTSLLERLNLTLRQALAPLVRKTLHFCKQRQQLERRVVFFQVYYNFARPHLSLRLPLPDSERRSSGVIHPKWKPRTPGIAAGLTDHVWTFRELLTAKFEPIQNHSISR